MSPYLEFDRCGHRHTRSIACGPAPSDRSRSGGASTKRMAHQFGAVRCFAVVSVIPRNDRELTSRAQSRRHPRSPRLKNLRDYLAAFRVQHGAPAGNGGSFMRRHQRHRRAVTAQLVATP